MMLHSRGRDGPFRVLEERRAHAAGIARPPPEQQLCLILLLQLRSWYCPLHQLHCMWGWLLLQRFALIHHVDVNLVAPHVADSCSRTVLFWWVSLAWICFRGLLTPLPISTRRPSCARAGCLSLLLGTAVAYAFDPILAFYSSIDHSEHLSDSMSGQWRATLVSLHLVALRCVDARNVDKKRRGSRQRWSLECICEYVQVCTRYFHTRKVCITADTSLKVSARPHPPTQLLLQRFALIYHVDVNLVAPHAADSCSRTVLFWWVSLAWICFRGLLTSLPISTRRPSCARAGCFSLLLGTAVAYAFDPILAFYSSIGHSEYLSDSMSGQWRATLVSLHLVALRCVDARNVDKKRRGSRQRWSLECICEYVQVCTRYFHTRKVCITADTSLKVSARCPARYFLQPRRICVWMQHGALAEHRLQTACKRTARRFSTSAPFTD